MRGVEDHLSPDWFDSFIEYQTKMIRKFKRLQTIYKFEIVDGHRSIEAISADLRSKVEAVLAGKLHAR